MEREEITYPLGNSDFLRVLTNSFKEFIERVHLGALQNLNRYTVR